MHTRLPATSPCAGARAVAGAAAGTRRLIYTGALLGCPALLLICRLGLVPATEVRAQPAAHWTAVPTTGEAPVPRSQFGLAADGRGNVYLFGGRSAIGTLLADFWRFRPSNRTWQQLVNLTIPPLVEPHLAVDAAGNVYEFGGLTSPGFPHCSPDGHSFGLYRFDPERDTWADLTPPTTAGVAWPAGREDFGLAYDRPTNRLYVFAGEGQAGAALNDLWSYDLASGRWLEIVQSYAGSGGVAIAPREIYNLSDDGHGGLDLFGGSYLAAGAVGHAPPPYANDLWRFTIASHTWTLLAGTANGYDPAMPLPRHYFAQSTDPAGNLYLLGGYLSATSNPPFFAGDHSAVYAQPALLQGSVLMPGLATYALDDYWEFNRATMRWRDLSAELGDLRGAGFIPYMMAWDPPDDLFITFGGFHPSPGGELLAGNGVWAIAPAADERKAVLSAAKH